MGHLLMIESWVGAMSTLLPRAIGEAGHRFTFLTRDLHHYLRSAPAGGPHPLLSAENVLTAETNDLDALLPRVERLHEVFGFDGVLSSCDYYLGTVARVAEHLGLPGAGSAAVERAYRKDLAREAMRAAGLPGPAFAVTEGWAATASAAASLGYPLVVKPVDLCAGMYVRRVVDEAELKEAFLALEGFPVNARQQPRLSAVLLEEVLTGQEVSVETVTYRGETHVVGVTDKSVVGDPWFVENGHMFPADLDPDLRRAAEDMAVAALRAVGLDHGVAHTELKLTPDGPRVVEINPRPAGNRITELVRRVSGVDLPMAFAELALGNRPALDPVDTGARSAAISFLLPPGEGVVERVHGVDALAVDPDVVEWQVKGAGTRAGAATSNNTYLGHVMVVDRRGAGARAHAERLVGGLRVEYASEAER
ncbi:argininosuccinate lyase [Streptoalloteichus tenebrarius]|uniref:Argininosuccinate lyase n=1 Tax=Streptoalloteichus tenebrarius (strain ATCC 17920 / DSM 40477 / JCM 4838 / CBS 697.72 / NBRC 16177 / NCIMB 11028 / NRRL B-12390 / A12253. 1 / ISP 5477) TaxID=1933 RepID=A0ABT1HPB9_STRSD|nr:ATP-grasp domain-containing protein [Streptoalloteichus tenebrarius]MCP2257357.1 argininosuccinate lyase [Streptoalloteichus tenebrarius]BFF04270.1 ATP-grasp domain-containing protein [Streptoalloteichus tenebrarius]